MVPWPALSLISRMWDEDIQIYITKNQHEDKGIIWNVDAKYSIEVHIDEHKCDIA